MVIFVMYESMYTLLLVSTSHKWLLAQFQPKTATKVLSNKQSDQIWSKRQQSLGTICSFMICEDIHHRRCHFRTFLQWDKNKRHKWSWQTIQTEWIYYILNSMRIIEDYQWLWRNYSDSTVMTVGNTCSTYNIGDMEDAGAPPIHDYYVLRTPSSTVYYPL